MSEPLEPYVREAFLRIGKTPRFPLFKPSNNPPQVIRDAVNHIVVYRGAFNPPHVGHLGLLQHVLLYHGNGLNIVAAMVYPKNDAYIQYKNERAREKFEITQEDRCVLWEDDHKFPNRAFTWKLCDGQAQVFARKLIEVAGKTGIRIKFIWLLGAELMPTRGGFSDWGGLCQDAVLSDFGRPNERFPFSRPAQIRGYLHWTPISYEIEREGRLLRSGTFTPYHGQSPLVAVVWRCVSIDDSHRKIYFVAYTGNARSHAPVEGLSSTRIRQGLREERGAELVSTMSGMALSPGLLLNKIASGAVRMDVDQRESIRGSLSL